MTHMKPAVRSVQVDGIIYAEMDKAILFIGVVDTPHGSQFVSAIADSDEAAEITLSKMGKVVVLRQVVDILAEFIDTAPPQPSALRH